MNIIDLKLGKFSYNSNYNKNPLFPKWAKILLFVLIIFIILRITTCIYHCNYPKHIQINDTQRSKANNRSIT